MNDGPRARDSRARRTRGPTAPSRAVEAPARTRDLAATMAEIVRGTACTGQAFFDSLVLCLSRALGVRWAIVGEMRLAESIRSLGFAADGVLQPPLEYHLRGTPCADVMRGNVCHYPSGVADQFPDDVMLREIGAVSYLGVPLRSSAGVPLGILVVLHDQVIESELDPASILQIFGGRAAADLERLHHERDSVQRQERLHLALEAARMGTWEWDALADAVGWSDRENEVCGFAPGTAIETFADYLIRLHPDDRPVLQQAVDEALAGAHDSYVCEHRVRQEDGGYRWVEGRGKMFRDGAGRAARLVGTLADVDARKRTEAELAASAQRLRRSEEMFSKIFRSSPVAVVIARTEAKGIVDVNDAMLEVTGFRREDVIGRNGMELGMWERPERDRITEELVRQGRVRDEVVELKTPRGLLSMSLSAELIEIAEEPHFLVLAQDITDRKRLEAGLRAAAREWNECFDALPVGLVIAGGDGRIRRANRRFLEWSGVEQFRDLVGRTLDSLGDGEPWAGLMALSRSHGSTGPRDEVDDPGTGRAWRVAWSDFPVAEGEGPAVVLVLRDVTETTRLRAELERQERLASMGSLVAGVAHEVRTPLFSISATIDAFEGGTPEEMKEGTQLLRAQVRRLSNVMRDLLDYGKPPALRLEVGGMAEIVDRAVRACEPSASDAGVMLRQDVPGELPHVARDPRRMEQAFQNLVANAIQHSPRGSAVWVVARAEGRDLVECRIEDQGPGIPEESLTRVFEPFFTRRRGGTGLGLSIVQRIVEAHGGQMAAANRLNGGAVFILSLPVAATRLAERSDV